MDGKMANKILLWKIKIKTKRNEWILGAKKRYQFVIKRGFDCVRFSIRDRVRDVVERESIVEAKECCRQGQINDLQHEEVTPL